MASKTGGGLVKISFVIPERHVEKLRTIAAERSSDWRRVSMADVHREVVELGLREIEHVFDTAFNASAVSVSEAEVA